MVFGLAGSPADELTFCFIFGMSGRDLLCVICSCTLRDIRDGLELDDDEVELPEEECFIGTLQGNDENSEKDN